MPDHENGRLHIRFSPSEFDQSSFLQLPLHGHLGANSDTNGAPQAIVHAVDAGKFKDAGGDLLFFERPLESTTVTSVGFG
jgi:hypothetical protein